MRLRIIGKVLVALALCGVALADSSAVRASSLMYMTVAQMARIAPLIVRARCTKTGAQWDAGEIWTFTSLAVEEVWRGSATSSVTVRLLGGTAGQLTSHVSGVPRFRTGEEVVLFLEPTSRGDYSVVGWEEGTFRIRSDPRAAREIVTQDSAFGETFEPAAKRFVANGIIGLPLSALRAQVDSALRQVPEGRP